jgi:hypothetical protein
MIELGSKTINIEQFITKYGKNKHFQLINNKLVEMEPTGLNQQIWEPAPFS